jgi:hypothetical protein
MDKTHLFGLAKAGITMYSIDAIIGSANIMINGCYREDIPFRFGQVFKCGK